MDSIKVSDIDNPTTIHVVKQGDTLKAALQTLYKYNIHSAPVVDNEQECVGWVDLDAIVEFILKVSKKTKESGTTPPSQSLKDDDLEMLLERSNDFKYANILDALKEQASGSDRIASRDPLLPVTSGAPISAVFQNFAYGISRLPVVSTENPKIIDTVLTQSSVNSYLAEHSDLLGEEGKKSVMVLGLVNGNDKVVTVTEDTPTIDALELMSNKGMNNVGVVNDRGALKGCFSATDLKLVKEFNFRLLLKPVSEFVAKVRSGEFQSKSYLVFCDENATLEQVVKKLAEFRVHRVFICDSAMKPVGVVSLTDVARILAKKYDWQYTSEQESNT